MSEAQSAPRCWAEIDLDALRHNAAAMQAQVGAARIMAIVKADAYGHGAAQVAQALREHAVMFGVANVNEARELHAVLPDREVFILGPALPEERCEIAARGFIPSVSSVEEAAAFAAFAGAKPVRIHVVIDTGMGRIGVWEKDALAAIGAIRQMRGVEIAGVATHLPSADEDDAFTTAQLARFRGLMEALRASGLGGVIDHAGNSAAAIRHAAEAGGMVRVGLALYGSSPLAEFQPRLRSVMTWKTRITLVREVGAGRGISYGRTFITPRPMRVATLAAGYADGYPRHLSGHGAEVLVRGRRCAVLGRVTMDQLMVDVTALPDVDAGEGVVLLGRQGEEEVTAAELALKAGTIAWEIFTGLGPRVERRYL